MKTVVSISEYSFESRSPGPEVRFAFLSDLHDFPAEPVLDAIERIGPDAVLIGGDFIQSETDTEGGMRFLRAAAARRPVFCSSGKEHRFDGALLGRIGDTGAVLLWNQSALLGGVRIGGLNTQPLTGRPFAEQEALIEVNKKWLEQYCRLDGYKLLLCHHPEYYDRYLKDFPVDLILSGHAHGGQLRLFGRGLWAPGQGWFPRYTSGVYHGRLLVCRGLGNSYPVPRINNRPEILGITLRGAG